MTTPPKTYPSIQGRCPACRGDSLFIGSGGYVTCARLDCPNPSAADDLLHSEQASRAETELARLRTGEEDGYDPRTVPTPGQWLRRFNEAGVEERLDVVRWLLDASARSARCFEMNHEQRLADDRKAWVIVERIRDVVQDMEEITGARHWARILRKAIDAEQPAPAPAATQATDDVKVLGVVPMSDGIADIHGGWPRAGQRLTAHQAATAATLPPGSIIRATPREHCGDLMPAWSVGPRTECVLPPDHQGSHADTHQPKEH